MLALEHRSRDTAAVDHDIGRGIGQPARDAPDVRQVVFDLLERQRWIGADVDAGDAPAGLDQAQAERAPDEPC